MLRGRAPGENVFRVRRGEERGAAVYRGNRERSRNIFMGSTFLFFSFLFYETVSEAPVVPFQEGRICLLRECGRKFELWLNINPFHWNFWSVWSVVFIVGILEGLMWVKLFWNGLCVYVKEIKKEISMQERDSTFSNLFFQKTKISHG